MCPEKYFWKRPEDGIQPTGAIRIPLTQLDSDDFTLLAGGGLELRLTSRCAVASLLEDLSAHLPLSQTPGDVIPLIHDLARGMTNQPSFEEGLELYLRFSPAELGRILGDRLTIELTDWDILYRTVRTLIPEANLLQLSSPDMVVKPILKANMCFTLETLETLRKNLLLNAPEYPTEALDVINTLEADIFAAAHPAELPSTEEEPSNLEG